MNEEYLWSKKGGDTEIEKLEDLLSEFRYVPDRAAVSNVVESPSKRKFAWIFAFATPAFGAVLLAAWFLVPNSEVTIQTRSESPTVQNFAASSDQPSTAVAINKPLAKSPATIVPIASDTIVKTVYRPRRMKKSEVRTLTASTKLTTEEKYAYDRLMLALSIAGTKLKVVQDTIDRKAEVEKRSFTN